MGGRGKITGQRDRNSIPTTSLISPAPAPAPASDPAPQSPDFYPSSEFLSPATCRFATPLTPGTVESCFLGSLGPFLVLVTWADGVTAASVQHMPRPCFQGGHGADVFLGLPGRSLTSFLIEIAS